MAFIAEQTLCVALIFFSHKVTAQLEKGKYKGCKTKDSRSIRFSITSGLQGKKTRTPHPQVGNIASLCDG